MSNAQTPMEIDTAFAAQYEILHTACAMSQIAKQLALKNLRELQALEKRLEEGHPAKQRIQDRVQEAKDAVQAIDKAV